MNSETLQKMPLLSRRTAAEKSSLRSLNALLRKAFRTFDPTRGGLPPLELPRPNWGEFCSTEVFDKLALRYLLQKGAQALGVELRILPQVLKQLLEAGVPHPLGGGPGLGGALVELLKEGAQGQRQGAGGGGSGLAGAVPLRPR